MMSAGFALALCGAVVAFAAVQSVFGVGLLVFGTPTLLLLGMPFEELLAYLLPCSIVVSLLQVISSGGFTFEPIRKDFLRFTAPTVVAGVLIVLLIGTRLNLRTLVGAMLIVTAVTRALGPARSAVSAFIRRHLRPLLGALGLLHGLSNLGGGVLTLIVSSVYGDKDSIRKHIAFGYGMMASLQFATLLVVGEFHVLLGLWLVLPALTGVTYSILGQRLFAAASQRSFQASLTALIAIFGILLMLPA